jgi:hypothetical protein
MTLHYNEQLLRRAVFCFWWRVVGVSYVIAFAIVAAYLVVLVYNGNTSWIVGVVATVFAIGIAMPVFVYFVHYRNTLRKFRAMGDPEATFTASESSFSVSSGAGSSTLPWSSVTEVWQFPSFWLLLFSKAQFITLPIADITPEAQAFILHQIQASGGKIG